MGEFGNKKWCRRIWRAVVVVRELAGVTFATQVVKEGVSPWLQLAFLRKWKA